MAGEESALDAAHLDRLDELLIAFGTDMYPDAEFNDVLLLSEDWLELETRAGGDLQVMLGVLRRTIETLPDDRGSASSPQTKSGQRPEPPEPTPISEVDAKAMEEWLRNRPDVHLPRGRSATRWRLGRGPGSFG